MQELGAARRAWRRSVVFSATLVVASCGPAEPGQLSAPESSARHEVAPESLGTTVVVVAIDGARWQEVFRGVDPTLAARYGLRPSEVIDASALLPNLSALVTGYGAALGVPEVGGEMRASGPSFRLAPGLL